ncbi:MAG TPA: type I methionyl aminopeptidase [Syntrophothermus lipocalidus]|uniref:Methionine aminopeptidase n=1 Tax=Syntrophothermus lipocalidus (strain DSM 12680 / TGB-C1) TaxID=643648 RepID=D7CJK1_SYNLT|nr:type I methionyl aminopeptidase [Syntrophothermus lipocalidus]ADI02956.1 methionine aminopeptidase, type I [Syntrophothermus lipocalidus DSM 12680]HHV77847.1 type I methionyl aminopeptidase [Syntrophothermus lipocalidus]
MILLKTERELALMRRAGRAVAITLEEIRMSVKPGITTGYLDGLAEKTLRKLGATPAFKGYQGFPAVICASINEEVVHGIPGPRKLKNGDIIKIDMGAVVEGYFGDAAITVPVGEASPEAAELIRVTEECLYKGIEQARVGKRLGDISHAVQRTAESHGYSVVRDYVGHGIGSRMHEDPPVPNYGRPSRGPLLRAGMTLAIEPMVNLGTYEVYVKEDQWTVVTRDGKLSAHFEHTVAITPEGPLILTVG